jgi:tRNA/rRNA methyltransferase/tRNA (cytidine32/uridine32-2'-O)-methyltransferase
MLLGDIIIVLVRPSEPGNAGAVCRAMKNMGLSRLRLVSPENRLLEDPRVRETVLARAVHAGELWEEAEVFDSLPAALGDCTLAVGTTRRRGQHRKAHTLTPWEAAAWLREKPGPGALVFGNERTGLEDDELACCNIASHIPVDPAFPSLNLSHAVQLYAYELFRVLGREDVPAEGDGADGPGKAVAGQWVPLNREELGVLTTSVTGSLESLGFYKHPGREEQEQFLRDVFARAALTKGEGRYMEHIFAKAARLGRKNHP